MSSPRVPSVRLDDGRYVLPDAVCLWFFRVFEACKDEVFGCRRLRVLQYRVNDEPQDYRAQVEEDTAAGHAVVRVEPNAGFECEEDVPTRSTTCGIPQYTKPPICSFPIIPALRFMAAGPVATNGTTS